MKKLYLLLLLFTGLVNAQVVNIPDVNFKAKLLEAGPTNNIARNSLNEFAKIDTNNNGQIEVAEALAIIELRVDGSTIADLAGLESFTNLTLLNCSENSITAIPLTNLNSLTYLTCNFNQITALDLSGLTALNSLDCSNNQITALDFSSNPLFYLLSCSNNNLNSLNLKNGYANIFPNSDWSNNPNLHYICVDEGEEGNAQYNAATLSNVVISSYCSFTPGGNYNTIAGSVIFDSNNNGCDASDVIQPNIRLNINDGSYSAASFSSNSGNFAFYTQAGNFSVTPSIENPSWFNFSPTSATLPFADNDNNVATQNFCITANGTHSDIEVIIEPMIPAIPGFDAVYRLVYRNKGNQMATGNVSFEFNDEALDFISATVTPTGQSFGNLNWNYANLQPFENRSIVVTFHVNSQTDNPAVNIDDTLNFIATLNPFSGDENQGDNTFVYNQTVIGSYDPNDIMCLQGHVVAPSEIGNYLHYVVNFKNTGTADAQTVVIRDTIDPTKFDVSSLQVLNTSHAVTARIVGNVAEFIFQNISLHSGGHGNILLKIRSKGTLAAGDMVSKNASIYFDYNTPISTNIENTVFETLSNPVFGVDNSVSIYPNPTKNSISVKAIAAIQSVQLYDVQGRLLLTKLGNDTAATLDISAQNAGVYFVKVTTEKGIKIEKIVKE